MLMGLFNILPVFPLYYNGKTKFMPLHCSDICNLIIDLVLDETIHETIECVGPEELTFKEMIEKLLKLVEKKRLLIPTPIFIANILATLFQILPKPLITKDQIKLLNYDNVPTGKYKTNFDINKNFNRKFKTKLKNIVICGKKLVNMQKKNFKI